MKKPRRILSLLLGLCVAAGLGLHTLQNPRSSSDFLAQLPPYEGQISVTLDGGLPDFPDRDKTSTCFERYSQLDYLGRCGPAYANVGLETMPTQERGPIGMVHPSGWHTIRYDFVDGKYLYNRCHLIGYQLTAENANELNLITGTRHLNVQGMLPYENQVADYVRRTGNHVLYRVTPIYAGTDLVARGVEMEALSVEDGGEGLCFHIFSYNVQPGVIIDYATGESWIEEEPKPAPAAETEGPFPPEESGAEEGPEAEPAYILNINSHRFHLPTCPGVRDINAKNRRDYYGQRQELIDSGYSPCGSCKP